MIDLRSKFGPVEQQGRPNTCVPHAATSVVEAVLGVSDLSRLFVYWNARTYTGTTSRDAGCTPRNAMRAISQFGVCPEGSWPYDTNQLFVRPPQAAFEAAAPLRSRIKAYQTVTNLTSLKSALLQGLPVMFSMSVPDTFVSITRFSGVQPPMAQTKSWVGSHAMVACGFDDATGFVLVRNSFGTSWGQGGYCYMPYDWFTTMTGRVNDAWTIIPA